MHSISNPDGVRFTGPLAPFAAGLTAELAALGYTTTSATTQLQLAAHLSRWLHLRDLSAAGLTAPVVTAFLADRRRDYTHLCSLQARGPTLVYLRRLGAAPPAAAARAPVGADEDLLAWVRLVKRSVTVPVADAYLRWVRPFVQQFPRGQQGLVFGELGAAQVSRFLTRHLPGLSRKNAQMTATSIRSFLRFLHVEGLVEVDLALAVPPFAFRRHSGLPEPLTPQQVQALVGACDPSSPVGRRDLAVIAGLLRLGLRCGEVAALRLEDLDWADGTVTVHGKGHRVDVMPLPVDVGQALVDYLREGRPRTGERVVFLTAVAHRLYPEWDYTADSTVANRGTRSRALRKTGEHETAGAIDSLRHHDLGVPFGT
ncbi:MAG TPA: tyrosine-type recombinase/integrase [Intrasporangium sp.]|nr:tyrosine-type recombinase/integrase [Intrasporangium sp.]